MKTMVLHIITLLVLGLLVFVSLSLGSVELEMHEIVRAITHPDESSVPAQIIWKSRVPRTLTAILAGAALSIGGLMMQTLFRNPLVGPSVLGVNAGASMGAAIILLASESLGLSFLKDSGVGLLTAACAGAAGVMMGILVLSRHVGRLTLLVVGILFAQFAGSLVGFLVYISAPEQIQTFAVWNLGTFENLDAERLGLVLPVIVLGMVMAMTQIKSLNAWLMGADTARTLGIDVERSRTMLIVSASLLAGAVTCFCGPIAFLGVAVPHLGRALHKTADHRVLMPAMILVGAVVALSADMVARLPGMDQVLPINPVLALVGAPVVISVVLKNQRLRDSL